MRNNPKELTMLKHDWVYIHSLKSSRSVGETLEPRNCQIRVLNLAREGHT